MNTLCGGLDVVCAPCEGFHDCFGGGRSTYRARMTSKIRVNMSLERRQSVASLPNLHEKNSLSAQMTFKPSHSLNKSPSHPTIFNHPSLTMNSNGECLMFIKSQSKCQLNDSVELKFCMKNQSCQNNLCQAASLRHCSRNLDCKRCFQSLPDLFGSDITHRSTTLVEKYRLFENLRPSNTKVGVLPLRSRKPKASQLFTFFPALRRTFLPLNFKMTY